MTTIFENYGNMFSDMCTDNDQVIAATIKREIETIEDVTPFNKTLPFYIMTTLCKYINEKLVFLLSHGQRGYQLDDCRQELVERIVAVSVSANIAFLNSAHGKVSFDLVSKYCSSLSDVFSNQIAHMIEEGFTDEAIFEFFKQLVNN